MSAVSAAKALLLGMDGDATVGNVGMCWALVEAGVEVVLDVFSSFSKDVFYLFVMVVDLAGVALFRALAVMNLFVTGARDQVAPTSHVTVGTHMTYHVTSGPLGYHVTYHVTHHVTYHVIQLA